jgi:hypothetical protein
MKYDDIEKIVRYARTNVFTYQLTAENCAEVEFINADGKLSRDERPKRFHSHCAHNRRQCLCFIIIIYMLKGKESMYICFSF